MAGSTDTDRVASFETGNAALPRFLDGVLCADGRVRLFFGATSDPAAVAPVGIEDLREISGGLMVVLPGRVRAISAESSFAAVQMTSP